MTMIPNLTQHEATPEQIEAGVVDLPEFYREKLRELLTFDDLPDAFDVYDRAVGIAVLAAKFCNEEGIDPDHRPKAMIGGAPFLMAELEHHLIRLGFDPVYAFSRREVVETPREDGSVTKMAVFRHIGFVEAF